MTDLTRTGRARHRATPRWRLRYWLGGAAAVATALIIGPNLAPLTSDVAVAGVAAEPYSIFGSEVPANPAENDDRSVEVGVDFTSDAVGYVTAIRFYKSVRNNGTRTGRLWDDAGNLVATTRVVRESASGWQQLEFNKPVRIEPGKHYVASYTAPQGYYANDTDELSPDKPRRTGDLCAHRGVYRYGSDSSMPDKTWEDSNYYVDVEFAPAVVSAAPTTSPSEDLVASSEAPSDMPSASSPSPSKAPSSAPSDSSTQSASPSSSATTSPSPSKSATSSPSATTSTPAPTASASASSAPSPKSGGFPGASNTGVPAGTSLSAYTGPMTITTANTVIDGKKITGTLVIQAPGVVVKNSLVVGAIDSSSDRGSVLIQDSEVDGGTSESAAIGYQNFTLSRVEVRGARVSVACSDSCTLEDSWLHAQYLKPGSTWHVNGFLSNGGSDMVLRHNTLACDQEDNGQGGGCTGPAATFGDFAPVTNVTYDNNLFVGGGGAYCLYGGSDASKPYGRQTSGIVVTNNVFERGEWGRCAWWGPVASFDSSRPGNVWKNNVWDNGGAVPAAL